MSGILAPLQTTRFSFLSEIKMIHRDTQCTVKLQIKATLEAVKKEKKIIELPDFRRNLMNSWKCNSSVRENSQKNFEVSILSRSRATMSLNCESERIMYSSFWKQGSLQLALSYPSNGVNISKNVKKAYLSMKFIRKK